VWDDFRNWVLKSGTSTGAYAKGSNTTSAVQRRREVPSPINQG